MKDLIIIGSGVAGMTASIYASRYKIDHLLFGQIPGGQGTLAGQVENYPGYVSITGPQLMQEFVKQVNRYNVKINQEEVAQLTKIEGGFEIRADSGQHQAKTLILAMGASHRQLNIPGEKELIGKGVSYCSVCDAAFFKDKIVVVVGGGDAAVTGAIHLSAFAKKIYLIHRRDQFRAEPTWVEKMRKTGKIEEVLSNEIKEIKGTEKVEEITLLKSHQNNSTLKVDGVFIEIGQMPSSVLAKTLGVELNEKNYVKVKPSMGTNIPGVFAAGDLAAIQDGLIFRQFVTAAADGARAAAAIYQYLHQGSSPSPSWGK